MSDDFGPWSDAELSDDARREITSPGAVAEGFHGHNVTTIAGKPNSLLVTFSWHQDPTPYGVVIPLPDASGNVLWTSYVAGEATKQQWLSAITYFLREQLLTGLVRRAYRTVMDEKADQQPVVLLDTRSSYLIVPQGFYLNSIIITDRTQRYLAGVGLETKTAQVAQDQGRLLVHTFAVADAPDPHYVVGQVVVSRTSSWPQVELEALAVISGTAHTVAASLAYNAMRDVLEAGARSVLVEIEHPVLSEFACFDASQRLINLSQLSVPKSLTGLTSR